MKLLTIAQEIRDIIYEFVLVDSKGPVRPIKGHEITFYLSHMHHCTINEHPSTKANGEMVEKHKEIVCKDPFTGEETVVPVPPSVLSLFLVCHQTHNEAKEIFYKKNTFAFDTRVTMAQVNNFVLGIGDRKNFLKSMAFHFTSLDATQTFKTLAKLPALTNLRIIMDGYGMIKRYHGRKSPNFRGMGVKSMLALRGLEKLELAGTDWDEDGNEVDINSVEGIGPLMMAKMLKPKQPKTLKLPKKKRVRKSKGHSKAV